MCICYIATLDHTPRFAASAVGFKDKYWPNGSIFKISVLGNDQKVIDFVMRAAKEWEQYGNFKFSYTNTWEGADCRIATVPGAGSWSYIGTDNRHVNPQRETMNLGWIDRDIASNDLSTALHELGHFLGLGHEHQNPNEPIPWNRQRVIADLSGPPNNWNMNQIERNVLNAIPSDQVDSTTLDMRSIMMYFFPKEWTLDGRSSARNSTLSTLDKQFIEMIYPKEVRTDAEVVAFIKALLYNGRRVNLLDRRQAETVCGGLGIAYKPQQNTRALKELIKSAI